MRFPDLLVRAIQNSEIPLRFEPGAEESVAKEVTDLIRTWLEAHQPGTASSDFEFGRKALLAQLLQELEGATEL